MVNVRSKGLNFERKIVNELKCIFPDAERALVGSSLDNNGVDLRNTGALAIQCKKYKKYAQIKFIEEVNVKDKIPTLITAGDRKKPTITFYLEDFIEIAKDIGVLYEEKC